MPKYYCDYCKLALTHDSTSVRKSHLVGKKHIKSVSDYYEQQAKQQGKWNYGDFVKMITIDDVYQGAPGAPHIVKTELVSNEYGEQEEKEQAESDGPENVYSIIEANVLGCPPTLIKMPNPPPSVLRYSDNFVDGTKKPVSLGKSASVGAGTANVKYGKYNYGPSNAVRKPGYQGRSTSQYTSKPARNYQGSGYSNQGSYGHKGGSYGKSNYGNGNGNYGSGYNKNPGKVYDRGNGRYGQEKSYQSSYSNGGNNSYYSR